MDKLNYTVLGIETSCDETAAAVYSTHNKILSNTIYSQIELHKKYGGVMPEIASRSHLEKIGPIIQEALDQAKLTLQEIDVIAVTNKPGLPGSLLVGLCFAKALAWENKKKFIGVNHLEGHIFSACIEHNIPFPFLCITASGGHTSLYIVRDFGNYELIGQTLDDAAGEAFDKISKLINLGYPGGPIIEKLAQEVNFQDYFKYPRATHNTFNFSFSGLKTAIMYDLVKRGYYDMQSKKFLEPDNRDLQKQIASSLLVCIADIFSNKLELAFREYADIKAVAFVGGVACNKYIRARLSSICERNNKKLYYPSPPYCTDNGAMIAFVGHYKAQQNKFSDLCIDIR
jgi:N6-L-threonylcarbamoyladenine synthase